jgi:hypothetical protein
LSQLVLLTNVVRVFGRPEAASEPIRDLANSMAVVVALHAGTALYLGYAFGAR